MIYNITNKTYGQMHNLFIIPLYLYRVSHRSIFYTRLSLFRYLDTGTYNLLITYLAISIYFYCIFIYWNILIILLKRIKSNFHVVNMEFEFF